jgi:hypothetical protein
MDYKLLTATEQDEIRRQKLHALEIEHARLALDIDIALEGGVDEDNEGLVGARTALAGLERDREVLLKMMTPASENGHRTATRL